MPRLIPLPREAYIRPSGALLDAVAQAVVPSALRSYGVRAEAVDDGVRDVIEIAYRNVHHRGLTLPEAPAEEAPHARLAAYLWGIARRWASDHRRRARTRLETPVGIVDERSPVEALPAPCTPEDHAARAQRRGIVRRIVGRIPEDFAAPFVLHAVDEQTASEIAVTLGLNENTVRSRIARARARAQQEAERLSAEERRVLEGSPLGALFLRRESHAPRPGEGPSRLQSVLSAGFVIGCGLALSGRAATPDLDLAFEPAPRVIAEAAAEARAAAPLPSAPVPLPPERPSPPPSTPAAPVSRPAAPAPGDSLAAELSLIWPAQEALREHAYARAVAALSIHARRFPSGKLAEKRERLRAEARAGLNRERREGR